MAKALSSPTHQGINKILSFMQNLLPIKKRVRDLVSRLTLDDKMSQLVNSTPLIPRLGIPGYQWGLKALHCIANAGPDIHLSNHPPLAPQPRCSRAPPPLGLSSSSPSLSKNLSPSSPNRSFPRPPAWSSAADWRELNGQVVVERWWVER
jgi:hypothetical protein